MIEGEATFLVGDRTVQARGGAFVWIPRGTVHAFRVDSQTCRLLNLYAPAGFERLIVETATPAPARTLPSLRSQVGPPSPSARIDGLLADIGMRPVAVPDPLRP